MLATMVLQLCEIQRKQISVDTKGLSVADDVNFRFALLFSPCEERSPHKYRVETKVSLVRGLLGLGKCDPLVPPEVGRRFRRLFEDMELYEHPGDHWLPTDLAFGPVVKAFVEETTS